MMVVVAPLKTTTVEKECIQKIIENVFVPVSVA